MDFYTFPKDFLWGAATASYQIEGAVNKDGRGQSTWDVFSQRPGKILNNDTGEVTCDHYHLYREDVRLMKDLGLKAYRFSTAWPRIFPRGEGEINKKGIDFYDKLINRLLEEGITPFITLFHWDLPQALEEKYGGWRSKEVSKRFADYAALVVDRFSDRVKHWMTINEIVCFTVLAHRQDRLAPGKREPEKVVNQTMHNALLGHGLAVSAMRSSAKGAIKVGLVENLSVTCPVYDTEEQVEAARKAWRDLNQAILFPLFTGRYSENYLRKIGADRPEYTEEEMKVIASPCDFIGYNIYFSSPVRASAGEQGYQILDYPPGYPKTHMDWPIAPKAIYYALMFTRDEFDNIPVYITENGMAAPDVETEEGEILDLGRVEYLRNHLEAASQAVRQGCNLKGYFVWSLLDNFEWSFGYARRFGIVRVNYSTQKRTVKLSGKYFAEVIKANRVL